MSESSGWGNEPHYLVIGVRDASGSMQFWHCAEWFKKGGGWRYGGPDYRRPPKGVPTNHHTYQERLERKKLEALEAEALKDIEWLAGSRS